MRKTSAPNANMTTSCSMPMANVNTNLPARIAERGAGVISSRRSVPVSRSWRIVVPHAASPNSSIITAVPATDCASMPIFFRSPAVWLSGVTTVSFRPSIDPMKSNEAPGAPPPGRESAAPVQRDIASYRSADFFSRSLVSAFANASSPTNDRTIASGIFFAWRPPVASITAGMSAWVAIRNSISLAGSRRSSSAGRAFFSTLASNPFSMTSAERRAALLDGLDELVARERLPVVLGDDLGERGLAERLDELPARVGLVGVRDADRLLREPAAVVARHRSEDGAEHGDERDRKQEARAPSRPCRGRTGAGPWRRAPRASRMVSMIIGSVPQRPPGEREEHGFEVGLAERHGPERDPRAPSTARGCPAARRRRPPGS